MSGGSQVIRGYRHSTDAILAHAVERNAPEIDMDDAEEIQPVRGVEKMPVGTRIEHDGKVYEVTLAPRCFPKGSCAGCARCAVLEGPLDSCEAGGRDDGLDVVMREVSE
jgi:hypothetical protein